MNKKAEAEIKKMKEQAAKNKAEKESAIRGKFVSEFSKGTKELVDAMVEKHGEGRDKEDFAWEIFQVFMTTGAMIGFTTMGMEASDMLGYTHEMCNDLLPMFDEDHICPECAAEAEAEEEARVEAEKASKKKSSSKKGTATVKPDGNLN